MACHVVVLIGPGYEVDLMEVLDPHTVAGLLKLHFREQKSSLIPRGLPLTQLMIHVKNLDVCHSIMGYI